VTIELINDNDTWDEFIEGSPHGLIFHKWDSLKIIKKYLTYDLYTYGIYDENVLVGLLPLFYKRINGCKTIFSPPPRTGIPYMGLVMNREYDRSSQKKKEGYLNFCVEEISKEIAKYNPNYLLISTVPGFLDIRPFQWDNYSINPNYTYILDLTRPQEDILNNFHRYLRKDIRHAENKGFRFQVSEDISAFYEMQKKRYKEQNLSDPVENEKYVKNLFEAYPENLRTYYVYSDKNEALGAITVQEYKKRFMTWMGTTKSIEHANEFLIWNLIKHAKENDYEKFELMGANIKNLNQFKSKFNPSLEIGYTIQKKDAFGKLSEWVYLNMIKKKWI
jgi:hypothetical protein